jgi:hypothetical protein
VAGAKKYKYNTNTYTTKYTPPSGVFFFPATDTGTAAQNTRITYSVMMETMGNKHARHTTTMKKNKTPN